MKVSDFAPDELAVKVKEGELVVEGEQPDLPTPHGVSSRQFTRRFALPPVRLIYFNFISFIYYYFYFICLLFVSL